MERLLPAAHTLDAETGGGCSAVKCTARRVRSMPAWVMTMRQCCCSPQAQALCWRAASWPAVIPQCACAAAAPAAPCTQDVCCQSEAARKAAVPQWCSCLVCGLHAQAIGCEIRHAEIPQRTSSRSPHKSRFRCSSHALLQLGHVLFCQVTRTGLGQAAKQSGQDQHVQIGASEAHEQPLAGFGEGLCPCG